MKTIPYHLFFALVALDVFALAVGIWILKLGPAPFERFGIPLSLVRQLALIALAAGIGLFFVLMVLIAQNS